jgi:cytochrome P450
MSLVLARLRSASTGVGTLIVTLLTTRGGVRTRLKTALGSAAGQRALFAILRLLKPRLKLGSNPIKPYAAQGSLVLTRADDVDAVLAREADFAVVYEPRMRRVTAGPNFFLGMQDGPEYQRDAQAMRRLIQPDDLARIVLPMVRAEAVSAIAGASTGIDAGTAAGTGIDLPSRLTARIPALMVQRYFGLHTASVDDLIPWATAMFHYLFSELTAEAAAEAAALTAAAKTRDALDAAVLAPTPDTLIARAVAARYAGEVAFQGDGIRNNMIGIVIGAIPTLSKAACFALDELFRRPRALASATAAAQAGNETLVAGHIWEAMRFNPVNPVIYRRAVADCALGGTAIAKNTMVLAANLSSMHDEAAVQHPHKWRTDRSWGQYLLWGRGVHLCFGDRINHALLPAMLMPLLALPRLRRAAGNAGQIDMRLDGLETPFPRHFIVEWGPTR